MSMTKVKPVVCVALFVILMMAGVALAQPAPTEVKRNSETDREKIDKRIQEIQPTAKELRFDAIGWVAGIREAERLAKENGRPVFLFSNVGQMDLGRC